MTGSTDSTGSAEVIYACHGTEVPLDVLANGRLASTLGENGQAALRGTEVSPIGDPATWRVIEEGGERVALVRPLDPPGKREQGSLFTHEVRVIERFGPPDAEGRPGWHLKKSSRCDLKRVLSGLHDVDITLNPAAAPSGNGVPLLVTEGECVSGRTADGRIRLVALEETTAEVRVVIGVEPVNDGKPQTCIGNPATPYTLELAAPLGGRKLVNAGVHPASEVVAP
ncbi:hypothetical protein [Sinosporangium siamense]|uniref:hypothetical protein n=1 Tax=Sinosporangium siamense TaxID=1367973 RepID=UPI001950E74B|nr:hypothetical protein [Sinosporangium siamense]